MLKGIHSMKRLPMLLALLCAISLSLCPRIAQTPQKPDRQVAITIDDLPAGMADRLPAADITAMTTKLLGTLRDQKIPVVGFVNEKKLYKPGEVDERIKALQMWLDYGFELGNHTFSHASLNQVGLKAWEDDVIQGESVTRMLLAPRKMKLRYFRHPYLDTGRDLQTRREAEAFLVERGYRIAPITLDGWDWMFAGLYEDAKKRNDTALQQQIVKEYLAYHDAAIAYAEQLSATSCRLRTEADPAAARQQPGSRPHRRVARRSAQAWLPLHHAGRRARRPGLQPARHLCWRRRHRLDRSLGDHPGQDSAGRSAVSAVGD